jgi:hypothetical protein
MILRGGEQTCLQVHCLAYEDVKATARAEALMRGEERWRWYGLRLVLDSVQAFATNDEVPRAGLHRQERPERRRT